MVLFFFSFESQYSTSNVPFWHFKTLKGRRMINEILQITIYNKGKEKKGEGKCV